MAVSIFSRIHSLSTGHRSSISLTLALIQNLSRQSGASLSCILFDLPVRILGVKPLPRGEISTRRCHLIEAEYQTLNYRHRRRLRLEVAVLPVKANFGGKKKKELRGLGKCGKEGKDCSSYQRRKGSCEFRKTKESGARGHSAAQKLAWKDSWQWWAEWSYHLKMGQCQGRRSACQGRRHGFCCGNGH